MLRQYSFLRTLILITIYSIAITGAFFLWAFLPISQVLTRLAIGIFSAGLFIWLVEPFVPVELTIHFERIFPLAAIVYLANINAWNVQGIFLSAFIGLGLIFPLVDAFVFPKVNYEKKQERWMLHHILRYFFACLISFTLIFPAIHFINLTINEINIATILSLIVGIISLVVIILSTIQKRKFYYQTKFFNEFPETGFWRISRFPVFWGEITLWFSIYLMMLSLDDKMWILFLGPLLQFLFYTKYLIPKIEQIRVEKNQEYVLYQQRTNPLFPFFKSHQ